MTAFNTNICLSNEISSCCEVKKCLYSDNFSSHDARKSKPKILLSHDAKKSKLKILQSHDSNEAKPKVLQSHDEQFKRETSVCFSFLKGKCKKSNNCRFSHDVPQKLERTKTICKCFLRNACNKGDSCTFSHEISLSPKSISDDGDTLNSTLERTKMICKFFLRRGCKNGDNCSFSHVIPEPPKSISDDGNTLNSARNDSSPYVGKFWSRDQNFKNYLSLMNQTQPDFSPEPSLFPLPSPVSMSAIGQRINVGSVSTPSDSRIFQLNTALTGAIFSKESHSVSSPEVFHPSPSNCATVPDVNFSNRSHSELNGRNICMPGMNSVDVPGTVFTNHSSFAPSSENIHVPHPNFAIVPNTGLYNQSITTLNPEVVPIPHFVVAPETAAGNLSYPSSNPEVCLPNSAPLMTVESVSLHSYSASESRGTCMTQLNSTEEYFSNILLSTSNPGILHTPRVDFLTLSNHSHPTSNPEVCMSPLDSDATSKAAHRNHFNLTSNSGIICMPHVDYVTHSKLVMVNDLHFVQNTEKSPEYKKCAIVSSDVLEQNDPILESMDTMGEEIVAGLVGDNICEICAKNVSEKEASAMYKFGILMNCKHCFCLPCIKQRRVEVKKSAGLGNYRDACCCPKCLTPFDYIVPSTYFTVSEKQKIRLAATYLSTLKEIYCTYFLSGTCKFGKNCRYLHNYPLRRVERVRSDSITSDYYSETGSIAEENSFI